jgi:hypothetical protein
MMTVPDFAIDFGNGVFVDSSGRLTSTIPDNIARFALSQALPIPKEAVHDVFGAIGSVVPQLAKLGSSLAVEDSDLFKALGLTQELIDTFGEVAGVATNVAMVIPYVNIVAALVKIFMSFDASDPLGDLIEAEFNRLHARLGEADRQRVDDYVAFCRSAFDPALTAVADYQTILSKPKNYQAPGEVENKRKVAQDRLLNVQEKLTDALLHNWALPFDDVLYRDNWGYLQNVLHTTPSTGAAAPAAFPGAFVPFDHRPMVQMFVYGIPIYVTLMKAVIPEHRTTGQYHTALRAAADKLSTQMERMRAETIARTIYKAGSPHFKERPRQFYVLAVGAMDLRADTDDYFRVTGNPADHPEWHRAGNLYRSWTLAPAIPNRGSAVEVDGDDWWTINPAAVELANKQSERDYAAVLSRSGYFTLAHLEALMRHLSTEPNRSETVTAAAETWRKPLAASPARVKNDSIPFSPPIEAKASREPQECRAYVTLTTQPVGSDSAIGYRIRLVTLPDGRTETPFDWYVWNSYEPDGSRNRKLQVNVNEGMPLDPVGVNPRLLVDSISPVNPIQTQTPVTVTLTADTFDWFIPRPDNPIAFERIKDNLTLGFAVAPGSGSGAGAQPVPMPPPAPGPGAELFDAARLVTSVEMGVKAFGWDEGQQSWQGEKRDWKRVQITLQYELYWHRDQLSIVLKARPEDRNYVVYLVVEEYLARSGQYLRTPIQIRFNGQLTYVPQSFFDAEQRAKDRANGILTRIEKNYTVSRQPGPLDPVVGWLRPGVRETEEGMQEFLAAAERHAPEIVARTLSEDAPTSAPPESA